MKKKPKTKGVQYWKGKAWDEFSRFIRIRDGLRTANSIDRAVCVSCGRIYPTFGMGCLQAGHLIAGRGNGILFEPVGCHAQCYNCNITLKGNWHRQLEKINTFYGNWEAYHHLEYWSRQTVKFMAYELEELRDLFKSWYLEMKETKTLLKGHSYEDYRVHLIDCRTTACSMLWLFRSETARRNLGI